MIGHEQRRESEVFELPGLVAPFRRRTHLRDLYSEPERFHNPYFPAKRETIGANVSIEPSSMTWYDICQRSRRSSSDATISSSLPTRHGGARRASSTETPKVPAIPSRIRFASSVT